MRIYVISKERMNETNYNIYFLVIEMRPGGSYLTRARARYRFRVERTYICTYKVELSSFRFAMSSLSSLALVVLHDLEDSELRATSHALRKEQNECFLLIVQNYIFIGRHCRRYVAMTVL